MWYKILKSLSILFSKHKEHWDKPNGCCSQCGAPLNEYYVGGYKLHDGRFGVSAAANKHTQKEIIRAHNEMQRRNAMKEKTL